MRLGLVGFPFRTLDFLDNSQGAELTFEVGQSPVLLLVGFPLDIVRICSFTIVAIES